MWYIDSIFDVWRTLNLLVGVMCLIWSAGGYVRQKESWNAKSWNLWYSRLMFAVVQIVVSLEGLEKNVGFSYTLAFISIAGCSSFVALYKKGAWGYQPPA